MEWELIVSSFYRAGKPAERPWPQRSRRAQRCIQVYLIANLPLLTLYTLFSRMFLSTLRKGVSLDCIWKIGTQLCFWGHTARSLPAVLFLCCAHLLCLLLKLTLLEVWGQLSTRSAGSLGKMTALMKCTRSETLSSSLWLCTICLF